MKASVELPTNFCFDKDVELEIRFFLFHWNACTLRNAWPIDEDNFITHPGKKKDRVDNLYELDFLWVSTKIWIFRVPNRSLYLFSIGITAKKSRQLNNLSTIDNRTLVIVFFFFAKIVRKSNSLYTSRSKNKLTIMKQLSGQFSFNYITNTIH